MQPFISVTGAAAPLMRRNVDTDVIIRIERLTQIPKGQLGRYAFEALRQHADGSPINGFVLNDPCFRDAPILLADENFGCGSSREGAVWALQGLGIRCVIAPSFGDIFIDNCFQNGLLPIRLAREHLMTLADFCANGARITVDLRDGVIVVAGRRIAFTVDPFRRAALLDGLDDIGLTLKDAPAIEAWQQADRAARPWNWLAPAQPLKETTQCPD